VSAEDEEDERIEAAIAAEGWCVVCDRPKGQGDCEGCVAVDTGLYDETWWEE
jgi:hypothetical protein